MEYKESIEKFMLLSEEWMDTIEVRDYTVELFKNPDEQDLRKEFDDNEGVRAFLVGDDMIAFQSYVLHQEVANALKLSKDDIALTLWLDKGDITGVTVTDYNKRGKYYKTPEIYKRVMNHPSILDNSLESDREREYDFIRYFDEDIVGKWHEMDEAVIRSQISKRGREIVSKSREGHKELNSKILANLNKVMTKDFHIKTPEEKDIIAKSMGFDGSEKIDKKKNYEVIRGSDIHPDILYRTADNFTRNKNNLQGSTFIYDFSDKEFSRKIQDPEIPHFSLSAQNVRFDDTIAAGRIIVLPIDYTFERSFDLGGNIQLSKGNHLSLWMDIADEELDDMMNKLDMKIDYVHIPQTRK